MWWVNYLVVSLWVIFGFFSLICGIVWWVIGVLVVWLVREKIFLNSGFLLKLGDFFSSRLWWILVGCSFSFLFRLCVVSLMLFGVLIICFLV